MALLAKTWGLTEALTCWKGGVVPLLTLPWADPGPAAGAPVAARPSLGVPVPIPAKPQLLASHVTLCFPPHPLCSA